eukprot:scaffold43188_cov26-Tisochrysis_lutea.AAC.1
MAVALHACKSGASRSARQRSMRSFHVTSTSSRSGQRTIWGGFRGEHTVRNMSEHFTSKHVVHSILMCYFGPIACAGVSTCSRTQPALKTCRYPYNLDFDYGALEGLFKYSINNLGDPFIESNYGVHSRDFEVGDEARGSEKGENVCVGGAGGRAKQVAVLNWFARLWEIDEE